MDSRARTRLTVNLQMKDLVICMLIKHPRPVITTEVWKTRAKQEGLGDTEGAVTRVAAWPTVNDRLPGASTNALPNL